MSIAGLGRAARATRPAKVLVEDLKRDRSEMEARGEVQRRNAKCICLSVSAESKCHAECIRLSALIEGRTNAPLTYRPETSADRLPLSSERETSARTEQSAHLFRFGFYVQESLFTFFESARENMSARHACNGVRPAASPSRWLSC